MERLTARDWPWLGDHLAVDFANTVRIRDGGVREELWSSPAVLAAWLDLEPEPLPQPDRIDQATLDALLPLRDATLDLLHPAVGHDLLPDSARLLVDAAVRESRTTRLLGPVPGQVLYTADAPSLTVALVGRFAAAVVDLLATDDLSNLAICHARDCGQFFHRARPNQRWCSPGCGNRARVDRHRHRQTPAAHAS